MTYPAVCKAKQYMLSDRACSGPAMWITISLRPQMRSHSSSRRRDAFGPVVSGRSSVGKARALGGTGPVWGRAQVQGEIDNYDLGPAWHRPARTCTRRPEAWNASI